MITELYEYTLLNGKPSVDVFAILVLIYCSVFIECIVIYTT